MLHVLRSPRTAGPSKKEYTYRMRLDHALVIRALCDSRTEAQELIEKSLVSVNGKITTKQTKDIKDTDSLEVMGRRDFVSRGGDKLRGIFQDIFGDEDAIRAHLEEKEALDVGSSTGGFTDCLIRYGIAHVDAVDVGKEQFHAKLRGDERVSLFEETDIRDFKAEGMYDIIVADLSFISLEAVFEVIFMLGKEGAEYFLLIKPQFEVGKGNTKKGIVKDTSLVVELLKKYQVLAKLHGLIGVQIFPCHIQGGDGNQEFFLYGKRG
jgi:23S rRNA (cytidine1920-2'-O)/16S rRNA (cytidine1409-2'-O)-methyltransferase